MFPKEAVCSTNNKLVKEVVRERSTYILKGCSENITQKIERRFFVGQYVIELFF